jgi:hypothetical protein
LQKKHVQASTENAQNKRTEKRKKIVQKNAEKAEEE